MRNIFIVVRHLFLDQFAEQIHELIPVFNIQATANNIRSSVLHKPFKVCFLSIADHHRESDQVHSRMNWKEVLIIHFLFGILEVKTPVVFFVVLEGDHTLLETMIGHKCTCFIGSPG